MAPFRVVLLCNLAATGLAFSPVRSTARSLSPLSTASTSTTTAAFFRRAPTTAPREKKSSSATAATAATALKMAADEVKVGDALPSVILKQGQADYGKPLDVDLSELVAGKKVAIFAVPGAFTPGCSKSHLPSFIAAQDELKAKGVESTICVATNDAYVMEAWGRSSGGADAGIIFLSDANAELSRALGLAIEGDVMVRTKRFSLVAEDGVVTHYFSSAKESSDTWAPNVLAAL